MCLKCQMFPVPTYTNGLEAIRDAAVSCETHDNALAYVFNCLNHWAFEVSRRPTDQNIYNLLLAREYADTRYTELTGEKLPVQ